MQSSGPAVAGQLSRRAIIDAILLSGPASRAELARQTGLSRRTVSEVVLQLESAGWLTPHARASSKPGPSGTVYALNAPAGLSAAVDLGGTKVSVALGDLVGNALGEVTVPTDPRGGMHVVDQVAASVRELALQLDVQVSQLRVVVMGVPGAVQPETALIRVAPNVRDVGRIDVPEALKERLGVSVIIENDVNLAALGEQFHGHGAGVRNFAFVALGTGLGMGIVADGCLLRGARGAAGEIGYLPIGGDPYDSRGFALGTLEASVGSQAVRNRYVGHGGAHDTTVREIFSALKAGDTAARAAIEETGRVLASAIAAIAATIDPEVIILGGSIGVRPELVDVICRCLPRCTPAPPRIEVSRLGSRAGLVGALTSAAAYMRSEISGDPRTPCATSRSRSAIAGGPDKAAL